MGEVSLECWGAVGGRADEWGGVGLEMCGSVDGGGGALSERKK